MLKNEYFLFCIYCLVLRCTNYKLVKISVDTAENEPEVDLRCTATQLSPPTPAHDPSARRPHVGHRVEDVAVEHREEELRVRDRRVRRDRERAGLVELRLEAAGGLPRVRGVHRVVRLEDEVRGELVEPAGAQQARNLDAID